MGAMVSVSSKKGVELAYSSTATDFVFMSTNSAILNGTLSKGDESVSEFDEVACLEEWDELRCGVLPDAEDLGFTYSKMSLWDNDDMQTRNTSWKHTTKARYQFDRHRRRTIKRQAHQWSFDISSKDRMASREVRTPYEELTEKKPERFSDDPHDASFWERECFQKQEYLVDDDRFFYADGRPDSVGMWRTKEEYCFGSSRWNVCYCFECQLERWQDDYRNWCETDPNFWYVRRVCDDHDYHNEAWDVDHCHNDDDYYDYDDDGYYYSYYYSYYDDDGYYAMVDKDRELITLWECDYDMRKPRPTTRHAPDPIPDHELEPEDLPQFRRDYIKRRKPTWAA